MVPRLLGKDGDCGGRKIMDVNEKTFNYIGHAVEPDHITKKYDLLMIQLAVSLHAKLKAVQMYIFMNCLIQ